jgi:hypothetical protein
VPPTGLNTIAALRWHTLVGPDIDVGAILVSLTVTVTLLQSVLLQVPSART